VVVEPREALLPALEEHALPYIAADPTAEEVLGCAGIQRPAAGLRGRPRCSQRLHHPDRRTLNPKLVIVARASDPTSVDTLVRAGADRSCPLYLLSGGGWRFGPSIRQWSTSWIS
jgi:voltage-gated potassium channel Kch